LSILTRRLIILVTRRRFRTLSRISWVLGSIGVFISYFDAYLELPISFSDMARLIASTASSSTSSITGVLFRMHCDSSFQTTALVRLVRRFFRPTTRLVATSMATLIRPPLMTSTTGRFFTSFYGRHIFTPCIRS
uniref:Secreted protein n=1 Tax=Haemonchus placei TaxID=6290 RepID=A0A0N4WWR2_HAEPC